MGLRDFSVCDVVEGNTHVHCERASIVAARPRVTHGESGQRVQDEAGKAVWGRFPRHTRRGDELAELAGARLAASSGAKHVIFGAAVLRKNTHRRIDRGRVEQEFANG